MNLQENVDRIKSVMGLITEQIVQDINCDDSKCYGKFVGPEFNQNGDIAHQFSNKISNKVGDKLKDLYKNGKYSKVDFNNIKMLTPGMGSGNVTYTVEIPFTKVSNPCDSYTSFDHVGGWGHEPELERRKSELSSLLINGDNFNVSKKMTTKEGLQEYWIQWRNKDLQKSCIGVNYNKITPKKITGNDLEDFKNNIRSETFDKIIDIDSIDIDVDNFTLKYNEGRGKKVVRLTLAYNLPNEPKCLSCEKVIGDNTIYSPEIVINNKFEQGRRIFNLIALYPPKTQNEFRN